MNEKESLFIEFFFTDHNLRNFVGSILECAINVKFRRCSLLFMYLLDFFISLIFGNIVALRRVDKIDFIKD